MKRRENPSSAFLQKQTFGENDQKDWKGQKLGKAKWEIFCVYLTFFAASGLPRSRARAKVVAELYAAAGLAAIEEQRVKTWMRMGDGKQADEAPSWVCRRQYVGICGGLRLYGCVPVQALSVLAAVST